MTDSQNQRRGSYEVRKDAIAYYGDFFPGDRPLIVMPIKHDTAEFLRQIYRCGDDEDGYVSFVAACRALLIENFVLTPNKG